MAESWASDTLLEGLVAATNGSVLPSAMMAAGIALLSLWLLIRLRRRSREITRRADGRRESLAGESSRSGSQARRDELDAAMVRIQELTRECAAQIDNRIQRLEQVLRLTDDRIRHLEEQTSERDAEVARPAGPAATEMVFRNPPAAPTPPPPSPHMDPLTRRVHELADMGQAPIEIARQLDEPTGKVELILALRHASTA